MIASELPQSPIRGKVTCVWVLCTAFLAALAPAATGQDLAFELPDVEGKLVKVRPTEGKVTAVCFLGTECPMARAYARTLTDLQAEFPDQLRLVGVMSNRQDSVADIQLYQSSLAVGFELLVDEGNVVADQFGASRTPEAFLLDESLKLRYHGRIDDQYAPSVTRAAARREDLRIAIEELLSGKPVSVKETLALGCVIGRIPNEPSVAPEGAVTFEQDVRPVLERNCLECHRAGEIGPFAMDHYDEVVGWAETMLETIEDGRMPPWHADPSVGKFANQRIMTDQDKQVMRQWVQEGSHQGTVETVKGESQRTAKTKTSDAWQFDGKPDMVIPMRDRPYVVPKGGVVEYQYFVVDPGFTEDKWIQAAQVIPGSRDVVHHAIVFVRPPDGERFQGVGWLTGYVPGQRALEVPPGHARLVKAGSKFVFQMHYTPNGIERKDITQVGVQFADASSVEHRVVTLMAINQDLEIPPNAPDYPVEAELGYLPRGGKLLAVTPHMHYRGTAFLLEADALDPQEGSPDLARSPLNRRLLSVPNYDFNWQHTYQFAEPIPLNEIENVRFTAKFDNTVSNPFNPDPNATVTWGDQTWEEMAVSFFEVAIPRDQSNLRQSRSNGSDDHEDSDETRDARDQKIAAYVTLVLEKLDKNGDGQVEKAEGGIVVRHFNFENWDRNDDGVATRDEIQETATEMFR